MEILEQVWEKLGLWISSFFSGFERLVTSLVGSQNARTIKRLQPLVDEINAIESKYEALS